MVRTASTMLPLGTAAPDFSLPDPSGKLHALKDFAGKPLLVMFICNHCPFVKHLRAELARLAKEYQEKGVAVVAVMPNDIENYPDDSPEKMAEEEADFSYEFPYLYDETQEVAKAYHAACTPDFYVFDGEHCLAYRGQLDDSRPKSDTPVTGTDLRAALDAVLSGASPAREQRPSIGCNIKWKAGNAPEYFSGG